MGCPIGEGQMSTSIRVKHIAAVLLFLALISIPFHTIARTGAAQTGPAPQGQRSAVNPIVMDASVALGRTNPRSLVASRLTPGRRSGLGRTALRLPGKFRLNRPNITLAQVNAT